MVGYALLGRDPQCRHAIHTVHAIKINTVNKITRLAVDQLDCFIGLSPQSWHFPGLEPSLPRRPGSSWKQMRRCAECRSPRERSKELIVN